MNILIKQRLLLLFYCIYAGVMFLFLMREPVYAVSAFALIAALPIPFIDALWSRIFGPYTNKMKPVVLTMLFVIIIVMAIVSPPSDKADDIPAGADSGESTDELGDVQDTNSDISESVTGSESQTENDTSGEASDSVVDNSNNESSGGEGDDGTGEEMIPNDNGDDVLIGDGERDDDTISETPAESTGNSQSSDNAQSGGETDDSTPFDTESRYVCNTSSKTFHLVDCGFANRISSDNKDYYEGDASNLISDGYAACKVCNPLDISEDNTSGDTSEGDASSGDSYDGSVSYVYSLKGDKFHLDECSSAKRISAENRATSTDRDELVKKGLSPCKNCNP